MTLFTPTTNESLIGVITSFQTDIDEMVQVTASSYWSATSNHIKNIVNRNAGGAGATERKASHVNIKLKRHYLYITHYQLHQRSDGAKVDYIKDWVFLGSVEGRKWVTLDKQNDTSFEDYDKKGLFPCLRGNFKYFRIKSSNMITLQNIEFYGYLSLNNETAPFMLLTCHLKAKRLNSIYFVVLSTLFS